MELAALIVVLIVATALYFQDSFGEVRTGERLRRIEGYEDDLELFALALECDIFTTPNKEGTPDGL